MSCLLSRKACAALLGVSVKTVRNWDTGRHRVPWSAVKLLRIVRQGDLGALVPSWAGWTLSGGVLRSPEGRCFEPHESSWWALLVAQARAFRERADRLRPVIPAGGVGASAPARLPQAAVTLQPGAGDAVPPAQRTAIAPQPADLMPTGLLGGHAASNDDGDAPGGRMRATPAPATGAAAAPQAAGEPPSPEAPSPPAGVRCGISNTAHLSQFWESPLLPSPAPEVLTMPETQPQLTADAVALDAGDTAAGALSAAIADGVFLRPGCPSLPPPPSGPADSSRTRTRAGGGAMTTVCIFESSTRC